MPKILVIEAESELRSVFCHDLVCDGYSVIEAGSSKQGLHLVEDASPDLVLFDVGRAEHPGLDYLQRFLDHCPRVPVVAVVEQGVPASSPLCHVPDAFVTRSLDTRELRETIRCFFGAEPS